MDRWIGVDLDGTLAHYDGWPADGSIGRPINRMVNRVRAKLEEGIEVRVMTARVSMVGHEFQHVFQQRILVREWTKEHIGRELTSTCSKDFGMIELWDDRAQRVVPNTGAFESEVRTADAAGRLLTAQASAFKSQGILAPWRCALSITLSDVEQDLIVESYKALGVRATFHYRCGGGHAVVIEPAVVSVGAGALVLARG